MPITNPFVSQEVQNPFGRTVSEEPEDKELKNPFKSPIVNPFVSISTPLPPRPQGFGQYPETPSELKAKGTDFGQYPVRQAAGMTFGGVNEMVANIVKFTIAGMPTDKKEIERVKGLRYADVIREGLNAPPFGEGNSLGRIAEDFSIEFLGGVAELLTTPKGILTLGAYRLILGGIIKGGLGFAASKYPKLFQQLVRQRTITDPLGKRVYQPHMQLVKVQDDPVARRILDERLRDQAARTLKLHEEKLADSQALKAKLKTTTGFKEEAMKRGVTVTKGRKVGIKPTEEIPSPVKVPKADIGIPKLPKETLRDSIPQILESLRSETGAITLPPENIREGITKITGNIHKTFTAFQGLEDATRQSFINYRESQEYINELSARTVFDAFGNIDEVTSEKILLHLDHPKKNPLPEGMGDKVEKIKVLQDYILKDMKERGYEIPRWPDNRIKAFEKEFKNLKDEWIKLKATGKLTDDVIEEINLYQKDLKSAIERFKGYGYIKHLTDRPGTLRKWITHHRAKKIKVKLPLGRKFETIEQARKAGYQVGGLQEALAFEIADYLHNVQTDELIKAININKFYSGIKGKDLVPDNWVKIDQRLFPAGQGRLYHPAIADAIKEVTYAHSPHLIERAYDKLNVAGKMIGFYNPLIMSRYDVEQGWRLAGFSFFKKLPEAIGIYVKGIKDPRYVQMMKDGLFNNVFDYGPMAREIINDMLTKSRKTLPKRLFDKFRKEIAKASPVQWAMDFNNKVTWEADKVLRIAGDLALKDIKRFQKLSQFQITDVANDFFASYAKVPAATRRVMNKAIFTPTYKISMMRVLKRMWSNPKLYSGQLFRHYAYKALLKFGLPAMIGYWTLKRAYTDRGYRLVIKDEKGKEKVYALSSPLLEETKILHRPIKQTIRLNLAFVPNLAYSLLSKREYDIGRWQNRLWKIGMPLQRDIDIWMEEDRTTADKFLQSLGVAFSYKRLERKNPEAKKTAAAKYAEAMDLWFDVGSKIRDIKGMARGERYNFNTKQELIGKIKNVNRRMAKTRRRKDVIAYKQLKEYRDYLLIRSKNWGKK